MSQGGAQQGDDAAQPSFVPPLSPLPPLAEWLADPQLPEWLISPHMARRASTPVAPSFAAAMDAHVRCTRLEEKLLKRDSLARLVRRRVWAGDWMARHGFDSPATLAGPFPVQELSMHLQGLDTGVIKPVHATNAWGVFPFERTGDFSFRNLFDGTELRLVALLETLHAPMQRYMFPNKWQIEELVTAPAGGVPDDFKAYGFAGHVALILQVRRTDGGNRYKFYDANWTPVTTGKYAETTDMDLPPPRDPDAMMAYAQKVSAALPLPFVRVDMFETARGPVVGELTPEPGGFHLFAPDVNRYLGVFYETGEASKATLEAVKKD